ncbi:MAG: hypothetical protein JNJ95_00080 [Dechloromonas sp.]|nr:hypothetical protein [Dechloromonas sp.]
MAIKAHVTYFKGEFVASLSDGRRVGRQGWREMAHALFEIGVDSTAIEYPWSTGQRMITAGQQVALRAELRRLAHAPVTHIVNRHAAAA